MNVQELTDLRDGITAQLEGRPWQWASRSAAIAWQEDTSNVNSIDWYIMKGFLVRAKPQPRTVPWSKISDVPLGAWLSNCEITGDRCMAIHVAEWGGVGVGYQDKGEKWTWDELQTYQIGYSTDLVTWKPCAVEVEP